MNNDQTIDKTSFSGHVGVVVLWTENVYFYEKYEKTDTGTNKLTYDGQKWDSILLTAVAIISINDDSPATT